MDDSEQTQRLPRIGTEYARSTQPPQKPPERRARRMSSHHWGIVAIILAVLWAGTSVALLISESGKSGVDPNAVCKHHRGVAPGGLTAHTYSGRILGVICRDGYYKSSE